MEDSTKSYKRIHVVVTGIRYEGQVYPLNERVLFSLIHDQPFPTEVSAFKSFVKKGNKFVVTSGLNGDRKIGVSFKLYQENGHVMFSMDDDRHPNECPKTAVYVKLEEDAIDLPL